MFTLTDKVLIDRAARLINGQAKELRNVHGQLGWSTGEESRKAKLVYDRLLRDERDLRALSKRLAVHFGVKAKARGLEDPVEEQVSLAPDLTPPSLAGYLDSVQLSELPSEPSLSEQRSLGVNQSGGDLGLV